MSARRVLAAVLMAFVLLPSASASPLRRSAAIHPKKPLARVPTADNAPPTVTITTPTSDAAFSWHSPRIALGGTAFDDGAVASVTWSSDRGGSGTCTGTSAWTVVNIPLFEGANVITITATDAAGKTSTDTATVTLDTTPPTIAITLPTTGDDYETLDATVSVAGTASDESGIASVWWCSDALWDCGSCDGTTSWTLDDLPLIYGSNDITFTATDVAGNTTSTTLVVIRRDAIAPQIEITSPASDSTYATQIPWIDLGGTASDDSGNPYVMWSSDRGGSGYGSCYGDQWQVWSVALLPGHNIITVTAADESGNTTSDSIDILFTDVSDPTVYFSDFSDAAFTVTCSSLDLTGYAYDDAEVSLVYWWNDQGDGGICSGTDYWIASGIPLQEGANVITVVANDSSGNGSSVSVTVNYVPSTPGDAWKGLSLVSVPIIPQESDPKAVVGFYEDMWVSYQPNAGYAQYPDYETWFYQNNCDSLRGFWAYLDSTSTAPSGRVAAQDQPAYIYLAAGWNLIGQPFLSGAVWDLDEIQVDTWYDGVLTLRDASDYVAGYAWGWNNIAENYYLVADSSEVPGAANHLDPWRGYWVKARTSCTLIIPPPGQILSDGK